MTLGSLNLTHTFLAISTRSSIYINAQARWSPLWRPGTRWNPIKSARRLSLYWGPCGVVIISPWIQWAVTAINGVKLLSLHRSDVKEIIPRDFWGRVELARFRVKQRDRCTFISSSRSLIWSSQISPMRWRMWVRCGISPSRSSSLSMRKMARRCWFSTTLRDCE